ncbi:MAG: hypothetical protein HY226_04215 [Candidatus Vogelbacteria bacterium]|nr:hypothetical protein [Candidatus Vogelbacteria bacterium]
MNKMWKYWFGIVLSVLVALMPFLGFPRGMKDIMYMLFGIILIVIFFSISKDKVRAERS